MCGHDSCYVSAFRVFTYLKRENGKKGNLIKSKNTCSPVKTQQNLCVVILKKILNTTRQIDRDTQFLSRKKTFFLWIFSAKLSSKHVT